MTVNHAALAPQDSISWRSTSTTRKKETAMKRKPTAIRPASNKEGR